MTDVAMGNPEDWRDRPITPSIGCQVARVTDELWTTFMILPCSCGNPFCGAEPMAPVDAWSRN